jgi:hypothetical protein
VILVLSAHFHTPAIAASFWLPCFTTFAQFFFVFPHTLSFYVPLWVRTLSFCASPTLIVSVLISQLDFHWTLCIFWSVLSVICWFWLSVCSRRVSSKVLLLFTVFWFLSASLWYCLPQLWAVLSFYC